MLLSTLLTAALVRLASPPQPSVGVVHPCSPLTWKNSTCTNGVPVVDTLDGVESASFCCAACAANPQCYTWTLNTRDTPSKCFLKGPMYVKSGHGSWCTTGYARMPPPPPNPPPNPPPYVPPYPTPAGAKNVLFMPVDDMRPSLGAYNFSHGRRGNSHTPNIDKLAATGLLFKQAYVQYAYCSPSRNSFLTGRRPDTTRVWEFVDHFREEGVGKDWTSLPQFFKKHGYLTLGGGKIYHPSSSTENVGMPCDDYPASWSPEYPYFPNQPPNDHHTCANPVEDGAPGLGTWCAANVPKEGAKLTDQKIRDNCLDHLRLAKNVSEEHARANGGTPRPFFVACGLHKPHVPWVAPVEFYNNVLPWEETPTAADPWAPVGMPAVAWHPPADVKGMDESPAFNGTVNMTRSAQYRAAYYAATSYQDYNIGVILAELEWLGLYQNTTVVLFGDHGWQLGEHDTWAKMTNFEIATHIPLIIRCPWLPNSVGKQTAAFAEMVDVYPTLAALSGLPTPESIGEGINGTSLAQVFETPEPGNYTQVKDAAFSQFAKNDLLSVYNKFHRNETKYMGYSIRVVRWRYTAWFAFDNVTIQPIRSEIVARELYDHTGDTGMWLDFPGENINVINATDDTKAIADKLHLRILDYIQLY